MFKRNPLPYVLLTATFLLAACQTPYRPVRDIDAQSLPTGPLAPSTPAAAPGSISKTGVAADATADQAKIVRGTGQLVKGQLVGGGLPAPTPGAIASGPTVTLNFEAAELREVVRNILTDVLGESYTIDPTVGGTVTIRTTAGIPREALPATLEMLLRSNGASMVKEGTIWKIVPAANAVKGNVTPQLGNSSRALPPGYSVQIIPLKYTGVRQMMTILEPFVRDATSIRADDLRNLIVVSGTEQELRHILDTIDMFDVNWLAGMSIGLFTLQSADVKTVMGELEKALGTPDKSPLAGILRIIPIERMNALLIVTPQPAYLDEAKKWIERLDKGDAGGGLRFYVYQVQNGRAEKIAPLLQQAFTGRVTQQAQAGPPTLSPGTPSGTIVSPPSYQSQAGGIPVMMPSTVTNQTTNVSAPSPGAPATPGPVAQAVARALVANSAGGEGIGVVRNLQAVADKDNNTILIVATPTEYSIVETALKKLDIRQRQVSIQLTIAQVTLTDELDAGVDWLFRGGAPSGRGSGGNVVGSSPFNPQTTSTSATDAVGLVLAKGFNYIINNAAFPGGIQAVLRLLDTYGSTKVISNPHLSALDNQKATIKVGTSIPINQQTLVGGTTNAVTTTSSYIDTGVLLQVTPHINAGGLVTLEVDATVSDPGASASTDVAPPINTRSIQTIVAVPSGRTMVMGGLITENKANSSTGLPYVSRIPGLGGLFGAQKLNNDRAELIVFITPQVVDTEEDYAKVIEDLRHRMEQLEDVFPPRKTVP